MSCHIKYHSSLWARGAVLTQNTSSSIIISRVIVVSSSCVISSKGKLEAVVATGAVSTGFGGSSLASSSKLFISSILWRGATWYPLVLTKSIGRFTRNQG
eukprot:scaffold7549_cov699-Prasinococcus_capsulatus_cf.AAC.2